MSTLRSVAVAGRQSADRWTGIALPGTFPVWMKIEQGVCGLVLLGVVAVVNGRQLRSLFVAQ